MKFGGFKKSSISAPDHVSTYKRGGGIFKVAKCEHRHAWSACKIYALLFFVKNTTNLGRFLGGRGLILCDYVTFCG